MNVEQIEARLAEIRGIDIDGIEDVEEVRKLNEEVTSLNAQLEEIRKAHAEKEELRNKIALGNVENEEIEKPTQEERTMNFEEIRNSVEYGKAFVKAVLQNDPEEARALLSLNAASGGNIPVPTQLDNEIRNAWEESRVMSLVKKTSYKGNVKVGFERSATNAVVHAEGADAPDEEVLTLGVVELKAESLKKWITISDEAIEGTTIDTLGYIYAELAHKIVEFAESRAIAKIAASPATSSATAPAVAKVTATTLAADTIVKALAELSGKAKNVHIVMNRKTAAALKGLALSANYAIDVFDGLADRIVYTDALPAFSAATTGNAYIIAGDFGYGFQANFPSGNELAIKVDDLSLAEKDLVKVVGRQYVGMGVVAPLAFVQIVK